MKESSLDLKEKPSVILLAGLQGVGKTTTSGKLAYNIKKSGQSVLLVAADVYRPAAIDQLIKIGKELNVDVFKDNKKNPIALSKSAIIQAKERKNDVVIIDTAGRLHLDNKMMEEIEQIKYAVSPSEILYVADGMSGQDAVKSTIVFNKRFH